MKLQQALGSLFSVCPHPCLVMPFCRRKPWLLNALFLSHQHIPRPLLLPSAQLRDSNSGWVARWCSGTAAAPASSAQAATAAMAADALTPAAVAGVLQWRDRYIHRGALHKQATGRSIGALGVLSGAAGGGGGSEAEAVVLTPSGEPSVGPARAGGVPLLLRCPLSGNAAMADPVILADGYTYEREAAASWLSQGRQTSPKTGEPLEGPDPPIMVDNAVGVTCDARM